MAETLDVLLKVARARRDAAAQTMNVAQQKLTQARGEIGRLEALERGVRPNDETVFAVGTFICHIGRRKRQLLDQVPGLERKLDAAKQDLLEVFSECKRLEVLIDRQVRAEAQEEARRDSIFADELAQQQYLQSRLKPQS